MPTHVHRVHSALGLDADFSTHRSGVSQERAERFGTEFDHYRDLLALYDRERV